MQLEGKELKMPPSKHFFSHVRDIILSLTSEKYSAKLLQSLESLLMNLLCRVVLFSWISLVVDGGKTRLEVEFRDIFSLST
jgi:hypothetical protein